MRLTLFKIAGGVFALSAVLALTIRSIPVTERISMDAAQAEFDEAWTDTMKLIAYRKADRERTQPEGQRAVRVIQLERITPEVTPVATVIPPVILPDEEPARKKHDVCTRHHMKKVVTRGGKAWRCKRV